MSKQTAEIAENQLAIVDQMASQKSELFAVAKTGLSHALEAARAIYALKQALTPEAMQPIMALQGSALGFKTDKIYPQDVLKECVIEAALRNVPVYGNCFNVIGGRFYCTKEGFTFLLKQIEGLTDLELSFGVPTMGQGTAEFKTAASWKLNGVADCLTIPLVVRVNAGMGADGALGKAERKLKKAVYERITSRTIADGSAEEIVTEKSATARVVTETTDDKKAEAPDFLGGTLKTQKPAPTQTGTTEAELSAKERINSTPVQPIKPAKQRSEAEKGLLADFSAKLKKCCIDGASASAAFARVLKVECSDWRKLPVKTIAITMDGPGWEKFSQAIADIANEQDAEQEAA